jgi:hypothetical protein
MFPASASSGFTFSMFLQEFFATRPIKSFDPCFPLRYFAFFGMFVRDCTFNANSHTLPIWFIVIELLRQKMSSLTIYLPCMLSRWTVATQNILLECYKFHVFRIATSAISAYMIQLRNIYAFSSRKFIYLPSIKNTMRGFEFISIRKMSISAWIFTAHPVPTSCFIINGNLGHKAFNLGLSGFYNKIVSCIHDFYYTMNEPGAHARYWGVTKDRFDAILEGIGV